MTDPRTIIEQNLAVSRYLTDRPRRPTPEPQPTPSLFGRLFRRRRDEQIRHAIPWMVASGVITPAIYGRRK